MVVRSQGLRRTFYITHTPCPSVDSSDVPLSQCGVEAMFDSEGIREGHFRDDGWLGRWRR